jgi:hypothetical protein
MEPSSNVISFETHTQYDLDILQSYKHDRTDWCHHELAIEVTAKRMKVTQDRVRSVVKRLFTMGSIA